MGKLTRNRVLWGEKDFAVPQGVGMGQEKFPHHVGQKWSKTKACRAESKTPSFVPTPPRPIAILSFYIVYL